MERIPEILENLLSAQETATLLRIKLGTERAWSDFLSDCTRSDESKRTSFCGYRLYPAYQIRKEGDRRTRPYFRLEDANEFTEKVYGVRPDLRRSHPIKKETIEREKCEIVLCDIDGIIDREFAAPKKGSELS